MYLTHCTHDRQVGLEVEFEDPQRLPTYVAGVAIATSGKITSHLRTWYSIHSLLIVMSPSKKCMRGCSTIAPSRSRDMSMP